MSDGTGGMFNTWNSHNKAANLVPLRDIDFPALIPPSIAHKYTSFYILCRLTDRSVTLYHY